MAELGYTSRRCISRRYISRRPPASTIRKQEVRRTSLSRAPTESAFPPTPEPNKLKTFRITTFTANLGRRRCRRQAAPPDSARAPLRWPPTVNGGRRPTPSSAVTWAPVVGVASARPRRRECRARPKPKELFLEPLRIRREAGLRARAASKGSCACALSRHAPTKRLDRRLSGLQARGGLGHEGVLAPARPFVRNAQLPTRLRQLHLRLGRRGARDGQPHRRRRWGPALGAEADALAAAAIPTDRPLPPRALSPAGAEGLPTSRRNGRGDWSNARGYRESSASPPPRAPAAGRIFGWPWGRRVAHPAGRNPTRYTPCGHGPLPRCSFSMGSPLESSFFKRLKKAMCVFKHFPEMRSSAKLADCTTWLSSATTARTLRAGRPGPRAAPPPRPTQTNGRARLHLLDKTKAAFARLALLMASPDSPIREGAATDGIATATGVNDKNGQLESAPFGGRAGSSMTAPPALLLALTRTTTPRPAPVCLALAGGGGDPLTGAMLPDALAVLLLVARPAWDLRVGTPRRCRRPASSIPPWHD